MKQERHASKSDLSEHSLNFTEVQGMEGDVIVLSDIFIFEQTGFEGGKLKEKVDVCVIVPTDSQHPDGMQHAEDGQWVVLHAIFAAIRQEMG